jgi:hypothetical protein
MTLLRSYDPLRLVYRSPINSIFLSEQISTIHQSNIHAGNRKRSAQIGEIEGTNLAPTLFSSPARQLVDLLAVCLYLYAYAANRQSKANFAA